MKINTTYLIRGKNIFFSTFHAYKMAIFSHLENVLTNFKHLYSYTFIKFLQYIL